MLATLATLAAASFVPPAHFAAPSITPRSSPAQLSLVESAKAGVISTVGGSLASAPAKASALLAAEAFKWGTWEVGTASFATELFVFGVVYRYAVRNDFASRPKQGTVLAFAVFRAFTLISLQASSLSDLGTSAKMLQLLAGFGESAIAFWGAAWALEYCWNRGYARRVDDFLPDFYYDDYTLDQMRGPPPYYRDGPPPPYYEQHGGGHVVDDGYYAEPVPIYSFDDARARMEANYTHAERAMAATFDNMELELTNQRQQSELEFARPAAEWEDHLLSARERFDRAISRARPREF